METLRVNTRNQITDQSIIIAVQYCEIDKKKIIKR